MPPLYLIVMGLYTALAGFIIYLVISNTLESKNVWEQVMAIFVLVPLIMRLAFVK